MKATQKFTPKYWVVHDKSTDDIFPETMRKTRSDSIEFFADKYGNDAWLQRNDNIECILIETKIVEL